MSISYIDPNAAANNNSGAAINTSLSNQLNGLSIGVDGEMSSMSVVDGPDTDPANSLGEFDHNHSRPIGMRLTREICGLVTSSLLTTSSRPELYKSINKTERVFSNRFATSYRNGEFNYFTGQFESDPLTVDELFWKSKDSSNYIDNAANNSRLSTGSVTWGNGSRPVSKHPGKKTG